MGEPESTTNLYEYTAAKQHEAWAHWMRYLIEDVAYHYPDGSIGIDPDRVAAWRRQIETPYDELSEREKHSDREQVDRFWPYIRDLQERLRDLRETVAKLPKAWDYRDGQWVKVPVVPGTQTCWCFYWDDDEGWKLSECRYVGHAYPWVEFDWELKNLPPELTKGVPVNCIYATREAAEQARREQDG